MLLQYCPRALPVQRTAKELGEEGGCGLAEMSIHQVRDVETKTFLRGKRVEDNVAGGADIDVATSQRAKEDDREVQSQYFSSSVSRTKDLGEKGGAGWLSFTPTASGKRLRDRLELVRDERVEDNVAVCAGIIVAALLQSATYAQRRIVSRAKELGEEAGCGLAESRVQAVRVANTGVAYITDVFDSRGTKGDVARQSLRVWRKA
ncbi:hypothetical protein Efla_004914 [Eimeria flavescens]